MIKRSSPIIKFLAKHDRITDEILDLIWKSQEGKHEETKRVVFETIAEIVNDIDISATKLIMRKIEKTDVNDFDEMKIKFLKDFTNNALEVVNQGTFQMNVMDDEDEK